MQGKYYIISNFTLEDSWLNHVMPTVHVFIYTQTFCVRECNTVKQNAELRPNIHKEMLLQAATFKEEAC